MTIGGFTPFNPVVLSMNWLKEVTRYQAVENQRDKCENGVA